MGQSQRKQEFILGKSREIYDPSEWSDVKVTVVKRILAKETETLYISGEIRGPTCLERENRNSSDLNPKKRQKTQKNVQLVEEFCRANRDSKEYPELVKKFNGSEIKLKEPKGYAVRITDLDGTVYWGRDYMLRSWSELYLPEPTEMVVIGAIDNFPSLAEGLQLIMLLDSQGKVYFYENEVLHLIACNLKDFFKKGATFPPIESYKYGQYTAPKSEEEYLQLLDEMGLAKIDKTTEDFIRGKDLTEVLDFLEFRDSKEYPELVKKFNGSEIKLKEPKGYAVRITDLDGTVYWGRDEMLRSWSELYLPEPTEMVVIGAIDNFPSLAEGLQLIVLVDSQGKVYFYENEVLHLIACNLKDFFKKGATFPPIESYKYGQYTAPKSEEEYLKLLGEMGLAKIDKSTEDFVQNKDKDLTELLDFLECL